MTRQQETRGSVRKTASQVFAAIQGKVADLVPGAQPGVHGEWEPRPGRIGIACSGGGIRSASYNLGALQALQDAGVLQRAEYLASVSGGGYIAAAMTMLAGSEEDDLVWARSSLSPDETNPEWELLEPRPFAPRSPEERYLRTRSSYLAPDLGGKVWMITRLLLGMVVNLAFLGALLTLAGRGAGHAAAIFRPGLLVGEAGTIPHPGWLTTVLVLAALGLGCLLATALTRLEAKTEARLVKVGKWVLILAGALTILVFLLPSAVQWIRTLSVSRPVDYVFELINVKTEEGSDAAGASMTAKLFAIISALGIPVLVGGAFRTILKENASKFGLLAGGIVAPALIVLAFLAIANDAASEPFQLRELVWFVVPLAIIGMLYWLSDLTVTSMHPFYKRRLSTAFALERIWRMPDGTQGHLSEERKSGHLDARERDYERLVPLSDTKLGAGRKWPRLIQCAAANISDYGKTPPGRRSVTFTFDWEWIGGPEVGYIETKLFQDVLGRKRREDITLPAAMAISGAALSPSMGAMTRPSLTLLLALVNARLGVWLPNPRLARTHYFDHVAASVSQTVSDRKTPDMDQLKTPAEAWNSRPSFFWLFREMLGINKSDDRFLYITDGGHWENLGLVELLRRGCTEIYCFDAAGDQEETFFTIGQAIAMARSELGVRFDDFDPTVIRPALDDKSKPPLCQTDRVVANFEIPRRDGKLVDGRLVFCKAAVTRDAPWDVRAYNEKDENFPNHSLLAQMFADQTFESYRALGYHTASQALQRMGPEMNHPSRF